LEVRPTSERLENIESMIRMESFRQNKGSSNEVGYYVFDFPAKDELIVREWVRYWQRRNNPDVDGFQFVTFDLYDIMIDILESKGYLEKCFEFEEKGGIERVVTATGRMLRLSEDAGGLVVEHIKENTPDNAVVFLTGVGKCYPILRAHKVLNNLHQKLDHVPVIILYPGEYDGRELVLFGSDTEHNYYWAERLVSN